MPTCCAASVAVASQAVRNRNANRKRGYRTDSTDSEDGLDLHRPPNVRVPADSGAGYHHSSPTFAARRRCGAGAAFTPVREGGADARADRDAAAAAAAAAGPAACLGRVLRGIIGCLNSLTVQTTSYLIFVVVFQLLTESLRLKEEYLFDKFVADTFLENHFDAAHSARRARAAPRRPRAARAPPAAPAWCNGRERPRRLSRR
jgi:hypothetical protein